MMNTFVCVSLILVFNVVLQPMECTAQGLLMVESCRGRTLSLSCSTGRSISIVQIELGETNCYRWNCCPSPSDCTNPASNSHKNEVLRACNGRQSCQVTAVVESITCNGNSEFERIKYNCSDIDECTSLSSNRQCSPHATCSNTPGSFKCVCQSGFHGDGFTCNAEPTSSASMTTTTSGSTIREVVDTFSQAVPEELQTVPTLKNASEEHPLTVIQTESTTMTYSIEDVDDYSILLAESRSDEISVDTSSANYSFIYIAIGAAAGLTILIVLVAVAIKYHRTRRQFRPAQCKATPTVDHAAINGKPDVNECERAGLVADDEEDFQSLAAVDLQPQVSQRIAGRLEVLTDSTEMGAYPDYDKYQG